MRENNINGTDNIIVRVASEFCDVKTPDGEVISCKPRGLFKKKGLRPLVGDKVEFRKASSDQGFIEKIKERKNELKRPYIANVDQVLVVVSPREPPPNYKLLDRLLVLSYFSNILKSVVCVNKLDLDENTTYEIKKIYTNIGYDSLAVSADQKKGLDNIRKLLKNKTSVLAGASGVGKSSLINALKPGFSLKTDSVSKKTGRGKHTTKHVALYELEKGSYVGDTPGFSKLNFEGIDLKSLDKAFPDISEFAPYCKFNDCLHDKEPGCGVKAVVGKKIYEYRYKNYLEFLEEIKERSS